MDREKVFTTLRKLDYLLSETPSKTFCDVWKELNDGKMAEITDEELEQKLKHINIE